MRSGFSSISNQMTCQTLDQGIKKSIREVKDKLFTSNKQSSQNSFGLISNQHSQFSSKISKTESKLSKIFKENSNFGPSKLITFANTSDSKDKFQTQNIKNQVYIQKIKCLEQTLLQLQEVISHLKEQNLRLNSQMRSAYHNFSKLSPQKQIRGSLDETLHTKLTDIQRSLELKQKVIFKKDQHIQKITLELKQTQSVLRKLQSQHSILEMSHQKSKEALVQQSKCYENKISLMMKELSIVRSFIPQVKNCLKKQSSGLFQSQQQNFKLTKEINNLKVENNALKNKTACLTKQNNTLLRKQNKIQDKLLKIQMQSQNITNQGIKRNQTVLVKRSSRKSLGSSTNRNVGKSPLISKRTRKNSLKNIYKF